MVHITISLLFSLAALLPTLVASSHLDPSNHHRRGHHKVLNRQHHHYASSGSSSAVLPVNKRTTPTYPAGWTSLGCYQDPNSPRLLATRVYSGSANTPQACMGLCAAQNYVYSGVEYGVECWCGNTLNSPQTLAASSCNMACSGDATQVCGQGNVLNLFQYSATTLKSAPSTTTYTSMGCYQDQSARTLSGPSTTSSSSMTPAFCEAFCNTATGGPYTFAGVENSVECYCGNTLTVNTPLAASNCQSKCSGDASQFCGGNNWQVALYQAPTATGTGTTTTATSTATGTTTSGFTSLGCYQDQSARTLGGPSTTSSTAMTPAFCENFCNTATGGPYQFAGVENSVECYCGNTLTVNTPLAASNCQTKCSGDATQFCGGNNWQVALYKTGTGTGTTTTSAATSTATSGSTLLGCYQDQTPRTLSGPSTTSSTMTPAVCKAYCASQGNYLFYGLENATECYCGQALIPNTPIAASNCQSKCAGDQTQLCGGSNWQVAVYQNGGSGTTTSTSTSATATSTSTVWTLMGCYQDQSARTLGGPSTTSSSSMTPAFCEAFCNTATGGPYQYAGVENSVECYCGNMLTVNSVLAASNCQTKCSGDATQFCGGNNWQVAVYQRSASTNTNTNTTLTTLGCYQDQSSRTLNGASTISSTMTPAVCKTYCSTASGAPYTYFGVENSSECYCGNTLIPNSPLALTNCAAKCAGDATQTCGGTNWELNLYAMSSTTTVVPSATYKQVGCFVDTSSRLLPIAAPSTATTSSTTYTPAACEAYCSSQNYAYAGVESGGECYCGGSLAYSNSGAGTQAALSDCSQACSANTAMQCGGGWRLMVYYDAALDTGAC